MSKGTILYIGGFELPDKNAAAHRVVANGKLLREMGYKIVFSGVTRNTLNDLGENNIVFGFDNYPRIYPIGLSEWMTYLFSIEHYKSLYKKFENVKYIIGYNMPAASLIRLKKYAHKRDIKIFADSTEWYKGSFHGNISLHLIKLSDSFIRMRLVQPHLDGVIAISEYLFNYYLKRGSNVVKIPPLVDINDKKWTNEFNENNEKIQIVYAGGAFSMDNRYVKDRLDLVVKALVLVKQENLNFIFKVVGCSKIDFEIFYPQLVDSIKFLKNEIQFLGKLSHNDAINIVKDSNLSIFIRDVSVVTLAGFPTKFVESISCGVPVITNRNSNVADYIEEGENGFIIDSTSVLAIKNKLIEILSMGKQKHLAMQIETYESRLFDYRKFYNEFQKLLN